MSVLRLITLACFPALLAACGQDEASRPILTDEAFFEAARACNAVNPEFIVHTEDELPSIGFTVQSPEETSGKTAKCLADALAGFRLKSMVIRVAPPS